MWESMPHVTGITSMGGPRPIASTARWVPGRLTRNSSMALGSPRRTIGFRAASPQALLQRDMAGAVEAHVLEVGDHVARMPLHERPHRAHAAPPEAFQEGFPQCPPDTVPLELRVDADGPDPADLVGLPELPRPDIAHDEPRHGVHLLGHQAHGRVAMAQLPGHVAPESAGGLPRDRTLDAPYRGEIGAPHRPDLHQSTRMIFTRVPTQSGGRHIPPEFPAF